MSDFLFGNNNRAVVKKLAQKSLKADKRRNILIIITIALTTILLSTLCFYLSAQNEELEDNIRGQYQAVCVGVTKELTDDLSGQPEVEQWGISKTIGSARYKDTALTILYEDENQIKLARRPAIDGHLPIKETEIMVEKPFLLYLNLPEKTGQTITMDLGDGEKRDYTVTGILQTDNSSRSFTVFVSRAYIAAHSSGIPTFDFRFRFANGNEKDMDALKAQIKEYLLKQGVPENKIYYSSNYFDMVGFQSSDNTMLYLVGLLLVIACSVVIYSLFYISVSGKLRGYGRLKVIGTTPKQLKSIVRREAFVLLLRSVPIGIILAGTVVFAWMPKYWEWGKNLQSALGVAIVMILAVMISTSVPIRLAGKVSAIEAVRTTPYSDQKGKEVSTRLHRRITPISLAKMSFERNRKKSVLTFISLGLTGVMLMCIATYAVSFDVNSMAAKSLGDGGNYMLSLSCPNLKEQHTVLKNNPMSEDLYHKLLGLNSVTKITRYSSSYVNVSLPREDAGINFTGFTKEQITQFLPSTAMGVGEADYERMTEKNGVIINDPEKLLGRYYGYTPKIGDVLRCNGYGGRNIDMPILGIAKKEIKTGVSCSLILVTDNTLSKLYPEIKNFSTTWNLYTNKDTLQLRKAIFTTVQDGRIDITSRKDLADSLKSHTQDFLKAAYVLAVFLFIFALVNLINTLMTNLFAKKQELAILQSVGMSSKQTASMLSFECLWYVVIALIVTIVIGGPAGMIICYIFNQVGIFGTLTYHFPWMALAVFAAVLLIIQFCYSMAAVSYIQKETLTDRIKIIE